jgi:hypothetical protein
MADNGYPPGTEMGRFGYPKGSINDSPFAKPIPADQLGRELGRAVGEPTGIARNDVAFQAPSDPLLQKVNPGIVYRDVPVISTVTSWDVDSVRGAMRALMEGIFDRAGQFCDAVLGDDRVQATMGSRLAGLWGREVRHKPANDSRAAKEVFDAWSAHWMDLEECAGLQETHTYGILMGADYGQVVWDTSGSVWKPYPRPWHPRYRFFHWPTRKQVAISQDGLLPVLVGNGKWYGYEPFGSYRSWVRGALRSLAEPWLGLRFSRRDWWRFNEVHGLPTRVGFTPAAADPVERAGFERGLSQLGSETTLLVPRGVDKDLGYGYELVEAKDTNWESFERTINECHLAIVLILKWQNLTTEITAGGSYAAAQEHGKGEVSQVSHDNVVWRKTIRRDFARPFALYNFGDPDLAPITDRDVPEPPREDYDTNAKAFQQLSTGFAQMTNAGFTFEDTTQFEKFAREEFGVRLPKSFSIGKPPAAVTAMAADKTADASHKTADAAITSAEASKTKAEQPPPEPKEEAA